MKLPRIKRSVIAISKISQLVGVAQKEELANLIVKVYDETVRNHGRRMAVKMLKALYNESIRFSCGLKVEPQTPIWLKRNRIDNYPDILKPFRKSLRSGSAIERRVSLSYLRVFESISLPVQPDLDTVVKPGRGALGFESFRLDYERFLAIGDFPQKIRRIAKEKLSHMASKPRSVELQYSTKRGVKGPTCATAGKQSLQISDELLTLLEDFNVIFGIKPGDFTEIVKVNQEFFKDHKDLFTPKSGELDPKSDLGRIAFIPDKGGKTRLVAIGNYWIQSSLRLFHKMLYSILEGIESDGTYNQTRQSERVCEASSKGPVWSWDLTAATDRFPVVMQSRTMESLDSRVGEIWTKILNFMSFDYKGNSYKYAVGQPMGLYSSWGAFALTHHYLVQYCAFLKGKKSFKKYSILGDDVAIWDKEVAEEYERYLKILDLEVSHLKSFTPVSLSGPCVAEFAKRIFDKGVEISPLSPIQCIQASNIYMLPEILYWLDERHFPLGSVTPSSLKEIFSVPTKYFQEMVCLIRINELMRAKTIVEVTHELNSTFAKLTLRDITQVRVAKLADQALDLVLEYELLEWTNREDLEKVLDGPVPDRLYFTNIVETRFNAVRELQSRMSEYIPSEYFQTYNPKEITFNGNPPPLSDLEYLPQIDFDSLMKGITQHEEKKVYRGRYIQLLLKHLKKV